jgi:hypothetical protein
VPERKIKLLKNSFAAAYFPDEKMPWHDRKRSTAARQISDYTEALKSLTWLMRDESGAGKPGLRTILAASFPS